MKKKKTISQMRGTSGGSECHFRITKKLDSEKQCFRKVKMDVYCFSSPEPNAYTVSLLDGGTRLLSVRASVRLSVLSPIFGPLGSQKSKVT